MYPIVNQLKHLELRLARCSGSQEACHFAEAEITIHGSKYEAVGITLRPCQGHLGGSRALKRARQRERRKLGKAIGAENQVEIVGKSVLIFQKRYFIS